MLALSGTNPQRHIIRARLDNFYQQAAATDAPEAHRLAATIETWWPAVEAAIKTGYSNSRSEGYNRLAKHQGRISLSGSATRSTNDDEDASHVPASTGGPQP